MFDVLLSSSPENGLVSKEKINKNEPIKKRWNSVSSQREISPFEAFIQAHTFPRSSSSMPLEPGFVSAAPVASRRTEFVGSGHVGVSRRKPSAIAVPVMRIGIPSDRAARTENLIAEVQTPPVPAPNALENAADYVRGNPLQSGAVLIAAPLLLRSAIRKLKKPPTAAAGTTTLERPGSETKSTALKRAVPLKHETRAEAFDLLGNTARKYIIVGGKGGVGKTSMSAAVATQFADRGQKTLIVSTDPAHSLSDAFGQSVSGGDPVPVLGIENLYAQEVDPEQMKRTFSMMSQNGGADMAGLQEMGLDDLNSLFETLPPGFDEAVALVEIIKYIEGDEAYMKFDRIVFDTAPTGHTLRLLSLPDFLNGFFGKIISMKSKFGNMMNQFKGMFGGNDAQDMDASMKDMEELKRSMARVRDLFRDEIQTEFVVATIPNMMAIAESSRLVDELRKEQIPVRHLFVNQVQPQNDDCTFCSARHKEHSANMKYIQSQFEQLQISTVQCFDREIKGVGALRTMGAQLFPTDAVQPPEPSAKKTPTTSRSAAQRNSAADSTSSVPRATAEVVE